MRIVFMGTPEFAVPCLNKIINDSHEMLAVFCQPDRPRGRKMLPAPPPVKLCAMARGLRVEQPEALRGNDGAITLLRELAPDVIVVVAYGQILRREILDLPKYGCVNVHASLLPQYRGAAPYQWAILNGETETGVTTMQMDAGIDTGDILLQETCAIPEDMTAGALHDLLSDLGAQTLARTLKAMEEGSLAPIPQDNSYASYAPMLHRGMSPIDWSRSAREVHNQVRGLYPWPGAAMEFYGKLLKVHRSRLCETGGTPLHIRCGDGNYIELLTVQAEGKRAISAEDFLRGIR